jgi:hypothetical protein
VRMSVSAFDMLMGSLLGGSASVHIKSNNALLTRRKN